MNNVETFSYVPMILTEGAEAWRAHGVQRRHRLEVPLALRPRESAGRVLRADGHDRTRRWSRCRATACATARSSRRSLRAARARHSCRRPWPTRRSTSTRWRRPAACSARAPCSSWTRTPTCWTWPRTWSGSSATSPAASASLAASAPRRPR